MDPDTIIMITPATSDSSSRPSRRSLLSLLGLGAVASGLGGLAMPKVTEARKKKKGKRKKNGGKGGGTCAGSINGSASASEETDLLGRINQFRAAQQPPLPALTRQAQLDSAAVGHSQDMARRCFFDHVNPDGIDPFQRMTAAGYPGVPIAENIYKGSGTLGSAAEAFTAWKNSPDHRANMLRANVTEIGIGTARDSSGFMNWTNVFGRQRDI